MRFPSHVSWLDYVFSSAILFALFGSLTACGASSVSPSPTAAVSSKTQPTEPALAAPLAGAYAALGASETYGIGATPHTRGYAYLLARVLKASHFVDVGIPGTTLAGGYDTELTDALGIRPSFATVFFGVNDLQARVTRASFLQDLHDLVATLRRAHVQVLIIGLPDLSHVPAVARLHVGSLLRIVSSWNAGMQRVAHQTGARFLNLRQFGAELAAHPRYIAADGLHPSNAGHARLAAVIESAIQNGHLWRKP